MICGNPPSLNNVPHTMLGQIQNQQLIAQFTLP